jgi:uncharacterized Zn-finger protein
MSAERNNSVVSFYTSGSESIDSNFSSFSSNSSWDASFTPCSSRRESFDSITGNDVLTPASSVNDSYTCGGGLSTVPSLGQDIMGSFQDTGMGGTTMPMLNFSNMTNFPIAMYQTADLYSPTSEMGSSQKDFTVNPSQTFYSSSFDLESPNNGLPMTMDISSISDYGSELATPASGRYLTPCSYEEFKPESRTPSRSSFRQTMTEPLQSSGPLHRVQNTHPQKKRVKREPLELALPPHTSIQKQAKKHCTWPGCNAKFQRQEHLKRHEKTHTSEEVFPCPYYGDETGAICKKKFGRRDNLKSHVALHANKDKKSSRTAYVEGAYELWLSMARKDRKSDEDSPCEHSESLSPRKVLRSSI